MEERSFEREVLERLVKIETKLDDVNTIKQTTFKNQQEIIKLQKDTDEQEKRINELEESIRWAWRTAVGAIITGLVGILMTLVQKGGI